MDILLTIATLVFLFMLTAWSCAKSYFERGRQKGMEDATREIIRGITSHCAVDSVIPESVAKAAAAVETVSWTNAKGMIDPYEARLWIFGDKVGEACWRKGLNYGLKKGVPAEGKIRLDLTNDELLQLSWLANLGFQHMMPNYRGLEVHRFSGEDDAREGASAVSKLELAIPAKDRPFSDASVQLKARQKLIFDWWRPMLDRKIA